MRMPSASFVHRSVILSSSSSAIFEYKKKSGPELSPKFDPPCNDCDGWFCANGGWSGWPSTLQVREINEDCDRSKKQIGLSLPFSISDRFLEA